MNRRRPQTLWIAALIALATAGILARTAAQGKSPQRTTVLYTGLMLDGRGHTMRNRDVIIEDGKITRLEDTPIHFTPDEAYSLQGLTVLPGWIDAHVHITYHFGPNGRAEDKSETPQQAALAAAGNAYATLLAGFTTVQSIGAEDDKAVRDAIERGVIPGPRLLTSLEPIFEGTGTPEELRRFVQKLSAGGANLVKIFASKSIREGGAQSLSQEQLDAACGEAKSLGLRTLVHAHSSASIQAAVKAGCTQIEHGVFATDDDLRLMAEHGTYFDPQAGLVFHNYFDNRAKFLGIENYTEAGFAAMEKAVPLAIDVVHRAAATKNLKLVFGTDAVAGAHGRNAEEFLYRVREAGENPMDAMVSANSRAAEAMNLQDKVGAIAPGLEADIIALDGNPLEDITAVRRVVFVMKGGKIYKNVSSQQAR